VYLVYGWDTNIREIIMAIAPKKKSKIKKVIKGLKKASALHKKQAKSLKSVLNGKNKKRS